ncbi:DUF1993 domain-containing protein [Andreprevotia chitinilytica]|uniref:DUF1993 domain-containing protein n=1 Tax=Andreprevotia chitinilytica TaxID=396808 RepID=UPI0005503F36|nr:DUF1993 domain-containing protein [Andreprevotia chitinilytica]
MSPSYYQISVPSFIRMLGNLSTILDKAVAYAAERKIDESVLLQSRLFPDMYPLVKQVQIATDQSKGSIGRLTGIAPPKFPDDETTFAQLQARIATTIGYLKGIPAEALDDTAAKQITLPWMPDRPLDGAPYLLHMAIPNVYFHVTTAYAILRHNGVPLGKPDFIGEI